jgi:hypothetical protein
MGTGGRMGSPWAGLPRSPRRYLVIFAIVIGLAALAAGIGLLTAHREVGGISATLFVGGLLLVAGLILALAGLIRAKRGS